MMSGEIDDRDEKMQSEAANEDENGSKNEKKREPASYATDHGRQRALIGTTLLHFVNDLHPTFLPTFLPAIVKDLGLSFAQAGFLNTFFGVINLFVQPIAGRFADKLHTPAMATWAPFFTALGMYLLPLAPNYAICLLLVGLTAAGTACFHPQGHGLSGLAGGTGKLAVYLAIFSAAGTFGAALSPIYGVFLLDTFGKYLMPAALLPVFGLLMIAKFIMPPRRDDISKGGGHKESEHTESFLGGMLRVFVLIYPFVLTAIVRDSTAQGIRVFLPLLIAERGGSLALGGTVLFVFSAAQAVSNLVGGKISDLVGHTRFTYIMLLLAPIFLFPAIHLSGTVSLVLFMLGGLCIASTNSVTLALAQKKVPNSRSTASSLVMGVSWGIANIVASPIGALADRVGLNIALSIVALCPLVVVLAMTIRRLKPSAEKES